jgi:agmatinase
MNETTLFHGEDVRPSKPENALFHIIPVPYERTVSYGGGTVKGPQAILEASCQLELFDGTSIPADYGIYTAPFVDCRGPDEVVLQRLSEAVSNTLSLGSLPVVIGGEHTVTLGSITALEQKHESFGIVQFDAHADLRDSYQGTQLSHASVMRRIYERDIPIFQIGTRSYSYEEHWFRKDNNIPYVNAEELFRSGVEDFSLPLDFPDKIYITFDLDVFDSSLMPATGTPVPGGITWYQAMWLIEKIIESRICFGWDIVELAPIPDFHSASFAASQLVYNMMGFLTRSQVNRNHHLHDDSKS